MNDPTFTAFRDSIDWDSPTLEGPALTIGDCLNAGPECKTFLWLDPGLQARDGDVCLFIMPSQEHGRREALHKWFVLVDGVPYAACKYFALPVSDFLQIAAVVVAELRWPPGLKLPMPEVSAKLEERMRLIRSRPPVRPDMIVFPVDVPTPEAARVEIRSAIAKGKDDGPRGWERYPLGEAAAV